MMTSPRSEEFFLFLNKGLIADKLFMEKGLVVVTNTCIGLDFIN